MTSTTASIPQHATTTTLPTVRAYTPTSAVNVAETAHWAVRILQRAIMMQMRTATMSLALTPVARMKLPATTRLVPLATTVRACTLTSAVNVAETAHWDVRILQRATTMRTPTATTTLALTLAALTILLATSIQQQAAMTDLACSKMHVETAVDLITQGVPTPRRATTTKELLATMAHA